MVDDMSSETARLVTGILGVLMLAGVLVFIAIYVAKANWKATPLGRHMLYFMLSLAAVLVVRTLRYFWEDVDALIWVSLATYTLLVLVIWQRVFLLVRALRSNGNSLHRGEE